MATTAAGVTFHALMRRTRHPATRVLAALTAFVTVWCLGCSAFDPLVERLLGSGSGMLCASEGGASMSGMLGEPRTAAVPAAGSADAQAHEPSAVRAAHDHGVGGVSCGCQSCTATSPATLVALAPALETPHAHEWRVTSLLDFARAPLVPPPEIAL